jgi:hypothetical protein
LFRAHCEKRGSSFEEAHAVNEAIERTWKRYQEEESGVCYRVPLME